MSAIRSGLRALAVVFGCAILISCQTAINLEGTGALTISHRVADNFENRYLELPNAGFYFVSADGQHSRYNHCLEGAGKCEFGRHELETLRSCERSSRQQCFLFASGYDVVWQGQVFVPGGRKLVPTENDLRRLSDIVLCSNATMRQSDDWEQRKRYGPYVEEAKRRGLSVEYCRQISRNLAARDFSPDRGIPEIPIGEFSYAPNFQLCAHAIDPTRTGAKWRQLYEYEPYVRELTRRGISPQACKEIFEDRQREVSGRRLELGTDVDVCRRAMDANWTPPWWGITYNSIPYAQAAQARGLTIVACQVLLGGSSTAQRFLSRLSDSEICAHAVTARHANTIWSPGERYRYHIAEAERRGYTPKTCMDAVFGSSG